jgi:RNA polymerase sigma-70 factor, ECF subfamily
VSEREPDQELRRVYEDARASWPTLVVVPFELFATRAQDRSPGAHGRDLYLACACGLGDAAALVELDRLYFSVVREAVARIDRSPDFADEVRQVLRNRLLVGAEAKIRDYRGAGVLAGWVRTAAVRTALNMQRAAQSRRHDAPLTDEPMAQILDPEMALLYASHKHEVTASLERAITGLEPEARLLLRFYYADQLTISRIAALEGVGLATVHRRLTAATAAVLAGVRGDLSDRLQMSTESLDSLLRGVQSQIDLSLSQLLRRPSYFGG